MKRQHFDITGAALSGFCFFHCLALPLLAGALPVGLGFAHDERVHLVILALAAGAAWFAFRGAFAARTSRRPLALLATFGLTLLTVALFVPDNVETILAVLGGLSLATAHLFNFALSRREHRHQHGVIGEKREAASSLRDAA